MLKDEEEWELVLDEDDMLGCPVDVIAAARKIAIDRKKGPNDYVVTLGRSMVEPFYLILNDVIFERLCLKHFANGASFVQRGTI